MEEVSSRRSEDLATDRRGLKVLTYDECLERVAEAPLGRVAFEHEGDVIIMPVNHVVDGMAIAFRTTWGSKLQVAADSGRIAFEVDGHDTTSQTGWSVLVQGSATLVYEAADRDRLDRLGRSSWAPEVENMFWVRVLPESVTGREILSASPE
jgi:uncharacterized protein